MAAFKERGVCFRAALLLLLALAATGGTQAERLPIKTYTTADGLARDHINRVVRDSRGFLWFCTGEGISRFDGYKFSNYTVEDGLPHRNVTDLLETREGVYWVATENGVCRFNPAIPSQALTQSNVPRWQNLSAASGQRFVAYSLGDHERAQYVNALIEDGAGAVWCGTGAGLYRLGRVDGGEAFSFIDIGLPSVSYNDPSINTMLEGSRGELWLGAGSGLYRRFADGRTERFTTENGLPYNDVRALAKDNAGRLWVGTTLGLCRVVFQPPSNRPVIDRVYTTKDGLTSNRIFSLFQSSDGKLWVSAGSGLNLFTSSADGGGDKPLSYTAEHGLSSKNIIAMGEDKDGNLWLGSEGGAMKMARNGFTTYTESDGLSNTRIGSIFEDLAGELCVIGDGKSINRFDGKAFHSVRLNVPEKISFSWGWYQNHFQDRTGKWWVNTAGGLWLFPEVSKVEDLLRARPEAVYTMKDGLSGDEVFRTYEDSRGDIWASTLSNSQSVLSRWERATKAFHRYTPADGIPLSAPTAFCEDANGNIWIGFYTGGVVRYAAGRFTLMAGADGLPPGMIRGMFLDHGGRLWIAASQGGLARVDDTGADGPRFVTYTTAEGLSSNHVNCVTEDQWGRIYVGTGRGLDRLDPATGRINHYTIADGLGHSFVNVAFRDRTGALWFGTLDGLSRFVPEPDRPRPPPPILISGLRIAGLTYPVSDLGETDIPRLELDANQNQIEIDFFGLSFGLGEALRYQYKLEGSDQDWKPLTATRAVNYASLSPGAYRFVVRAVSTDGALSQSPATFDFKILPHVWQRWWFVTLAAILVAGVAFAFDRYRAARVRAIKESEDRFRTLAETASDAIITIDEQSRIIFVNPAAGIVFGYAATEMLGRDLTMLMPEYLRHLHKAGFARYVETGQRHLSWEAIELPGLHKCGREIPLEISFGEFTRNDKHFFTGVARDITERKRAEEALRRSREERLVELEHVRRRIATDLHDDIGSSLSQIFLLSEVARQRVGRDDSSAMEPLSMIASASHELVSSMSDIVWAINPHKDHLSDLVQRMRRFASDVFAARNIEFHFRAPGAEQDVRLGASIRREVFLIFKESVNNITRHSECREADIEFSLEKEFLALRLSDDGKGFDLTRESDGHGLVSMRERAEAIGGEFEMTSGGHGTTVRLKVPLDQAGSINQTMPT